MKLFGILLLTIGTVGIAQTQSGDAMNGWVEKDGSMYWYEDGILQGYEDGNPYYRGKEIYDPQSDAWYWLDNIQGGAMAADKDVYQESGAGLWADRLALYENGNPDPDRSNGKWVRYDSDGHMVKGWDYTEEGVFYFDLVYGTMAKGYAVIDGVEYYFNRESGILEETLGAVPQQNGWKSYGEDLFWYEDGVRQGYSIDASYRGKEIYDPDTDAWYWLDNADNGRMAVNKDVYQESGAGLWAENIVLDEAGNPDPERSTGKWVRYDSEGHMVKGWDKNDSGTYYFDMVYGTMAKGTVEIDGKTYVFNDITGILEQKVSPYKWYTTSHTCYNAADGVIYRYTYDYDEDGRQTAAATYSASYNMITYEENQEYDESGELARQTSRNYTRNGSNLGGIRYLETESIIDYQGGTMIKKTDNAYNVDGNLTGRKVTDYEGDRVSMVTLYDENSEPIQRNIYQYDENNYLTEISYNYLDAPAQNMVLRYQNDADGNVLFMGEYNYRGTLVTSTVYTYFEGPDSVGSLLASYETRDELNGYSTERREYDYDERGNCVESRYYYRMSVGYNSDTGSYDYQMKLGSRQVICFDENGNQISRDSYTYDRDGKERHDSGVVTVYGNYGQTSLVQSYESYYAHSVLDESGHYVYDEDGKVCYELGFNYGYENDRQENGILVKQTFYEGTMSNRYTKTLNYWVEYNPEEIPEAEYKGQTYIRKPYCTAYNADGSLRYYEVYEYAAY